jgi:hypothetical protein
VRFGAEAELVAFDVGEDDVAVGPPFGELLLPEERRAEGREAFDLCVEVALGSTAEVQPVLQ